MIYADIIFWTNDINDFTIVLPFPPRIGDSIRFPSGTVKHYNGSGFTDNYFRISDIEWVFKDDQFEKLSIYVQNI